MKFLLKILCLLSLLSSFSFTFDMPSVYELGYYRDNSLNRYYFRSSVDALILPDDFVKVDNDVYRSDICSVDYVNLSLGISWGGFQFDSRNLILYSYFSSFEKKDAFCNFNVDADSDACFDRKSSCGAGCKDVTFSYVKHCSLYKFTTCNTGENFNTNLKQCVPACPAGQSWDAENNLCYVDCSDKNLNKYGYPNGTAQGGCVDCSNAFSDQEIASCVCAGFGASLSVKGVYLSLENNSFVSYNCSDGRDIIFKRRSNENVDKDKDKENPKSDKDKDKKNDNNSTNSSDKDKEKPKPYKDKENPKSDKDKDKKNDNNSTNSSNKDNKKEDTKPNKKDNNENSNNSSGESGNPSNNNSGGSAGNGFSGGGGTGVETKPNPNYNGNGKQDGKQDGKGEEGKGDDAVVQKLDYGDLEKDTGKFEGEFKKAVDDSFSFVNDVKASLTDTLQKIKDGNLMSLKKGAVPTTCPLSFQIDMTYFSKNLTFDFCKIVSPVSSSLYILFYLGFFILFLVVTIKLFILTFMGW